MVESEQLLVCLMESYRCWPNGNLQREEGKLCPHRGYIWQKGAPLPPSQLFCAISWHRMNLTTVYDSMTWVWDMQIPAAPHTKPKELTACSSHTCYRRNVCSLLPDIPGFGGLLQTWGAVVGHQAKSYRTHNHHHHFPRQMKHNHLK